MVNLSLHTLHKKKKMSTLVNVRKNRLPLIIFEESLKKEDHVYIGRKCKYAKGTFDSIWGNPFSAQRYGRKECIKRYETYVRSNEFLMREIPSLKGKTLGYW